MPTEGKKADAPTAGDVARRDVPLCRLVARPAEVRDRLHGTEWTSCIVVNDAGVVLGRVHADVLDDADPTQPVEAIMEEGPTTVRPSEPLPDLVKRMRNQHVETVVVTNSDGALIGVLRHQDAERHVHSQQP